MHLVRRLRKEEDGAAIVEMTIVMALLFTLTLGFVDFGYAFWQWNAAVKAVQVGARMASISPPIAPEIKNAGPTVSPGEPVPVGNYSFVCDGATSLCGTGTTWTAANFERIYFGDDRNCRPVVGSRPGMCDFFPRLQPANIEVRYAATGLGYQTRPGGAVPTITVSLKNLTFQFFFLDGLLGLTDITMPSMLSTVTGEDLGLGAG